jgi:hypothetical protein
VSRKLRTRATLVRASQQVRGGWSFPAHADPSRGMCNWPSIPSPRYRPIARRDAEIDAKHWNVWFARSPLLQPETWQPTGYGSTAVQLRRHPYIGALQTSVYLECQFSRIFPAHPRSLASVLSRARRHGASLLRTACALAGFGFQKILCATNAKRFSEPSEKDAAWHLGAGHTPTPPHTNRVLGTPGSRVASRKSVPRVIRANTTKEN